MPAAGLDLAGDLAGVPTGPADLSSSSRRPKGYGRWGRSSSSRPFGGDDGAMLSEALTLHADVLMTGAKDLLEAGEVAGFGILKAT